MATRWAVSCAALFVAGPGLIGGCSLFVSVDGLSGGAAEEVDATSDRADDKTLEGGPTDAVDAVDAADSDAGVEAAVPDAGCDGAVACTRVVFVTSVGYATSDLGSLAGADARCAAAAARPAASTSVRGRVFKAWLSNDSTSARSRLLHGTGRYTRPDGQNIAGDWTGVVSGTVARPINLDETGAAITGDAHVWTGTHVDGTSDSSTCVSWTSTSSAVQSATGRADATSSAWTDDVVALACSGRARLYCFEN